MDTNEKKVNETKEELIQMSYQGMIYEITKAEFEALQEGWTTAKEMFE